MGRKAHGNMGKGKKNRELYERMVRDHADELYRFAYRRCGNAHTAEDLVEETFLEAWRSLPSLRDPQRVRAWVYQILRHRYAHWIRDRSRRIQPKTSLEEVEHTLSAPAPEMLENLSRRELLQQALDALADRYREPFLTVFLEGFTCKETAAMLDLPLGTVLSRIHRARIFLREYLRELAPYASEDGSRIKNTGKPSPRSRF